MKKDQLNFLEQVLVQARCTDTPYLNSNSLKRLRASLKDNGCTHLLMYDYLNQHDDSQIVPILFVFIKVEKDETPDDDLIPLESEHASMVLALFLADCGINFMNDLIDQKDFT